MIELLDRDNKTPLPHCETRGPCRPWATAEDLCEVSINSGCDANTCTSLIEDINQKFTDPDDKDENGDPILSDVGTRMFNEQAQVATSILYRLSGEQFNGICCAEITICRQTGAVCCDFGNMQLYYDPVLGAFMNGRCCDSANGCNFGDRLYLPATPVCSVLSIEVPSVAIGPVYEVDPRTGSPIEIEGIGQVLRTNPLTGAPYAIGETYPETIPLDDVRLVNNEFLVFCDGRAWPTIPANICADPPGLRIRFCYGWEPPLEARRAAAAYACELFKKCITGRCALDERVAVVNAPGTTAKFRDLDAMLFDRWRFGLAAIDEFLTVWNPYNFQQEPQVIWPGGDSDNGGEPFTSRRL